MMSAKNTGILGGIIGSLGTAGGLAGMAATIPWPASNIAGFIVAGKILGGGAATSAAIAAVGGPLAVGAIAVAGIGAATGAITYGVAKLLE